MKVAIVTVTFNALSDIDRFIECCEAAAATSVNDVGVDLTVYVVDNASHDGTAEVLKGYLGRSGDWLKLDVRNDNGGIAVGNNAGIRRAVEDGAELVLLLNNDTYFDSDFVSRLVDFHRNHPRAVIAPLITAALTPGTLWYNGGTISRAKGLQAIHTGLTASLEAALGAPSREVGYASTCALLVPTEVFREVGLMDEDFFVYCDDVDFSLRVTRNGWKTMLCTNALLHHKIGASTGGVRSDFGLEWETFGKAMLIRKHSKNILERFYFSLFLLVWVGAGMVTGRDSLRQVWLRLLSMGRGMTAPMNGEIERL